MADPYLGEIRMVGFNYAPQGWAMCNGQLLSISQNSALFALLGIMYGGDGRTTFGLPNLQSRVPLGMGQGPGLSTYVQGQAGGHESVTLSIQQMPLHNHGVSASSAAAASTDPTGNLLPTSPSRGGAPAYVAPNAGTTVTMAQSMIQPAGNSQPVDVRQPYLPLNFIIALQGIFPPRS